MFCFNVPLHICTLSLFSTNLTNIQRPLSIRSCRSCFLHQRFSQFFDAFSVNSRQRNSLTYIFFHCSWQNHMVLHMANISISWIFGSANDCLSKFHFLFFGLPRILPCQSFELKFFSKSQKRVQVLLKHVCFPKIDKINHGYHIPRLQTTHVDH